MTVQHANLEEGWLKRQMDDVAALDRAYRKLIAAGNSNRSNRSNRRHGGTGVTTVRFSSAEIQAIAYMAKLSRIR